MKVLHTFLAGFGVLILLGLAVAGFSHSGPSVPAPLIATRTADIEARATASPAVDTLVPAAPVSTPMVIHADATADPLPTPTVVQRLPAATFEQQVATSQAAAVSKYPSLGVLNSALNVSFRREYGRLRLARSEWFSDAGWPLWLADECDQRVKNPKLPEIDVRAANESAYPSSRSLADASTLSSSPSPTPDYFAGSDPGVPDGQVQVRGYYRKNGTYVQPYTRSAPSR